MAGFVAAAAPEAVVGLNEIKAEARIATSDEDALIAGLVRSATDLCERFTATLLLARDVEEMLPAAMGWTRLGAAPVRAIEGVTMIGANGVETVLPADSFAIDIDAAGEGWVRLKAAQAETRMKVRYVAGLANDPNGVPEALRRGIARLAVHGLARSDGDAPPPAAVTALWRPWRRLRLGAERR
ncbi:MAG: hypothetical protein AB7O91_10390 [Sphingomonas sp.]